MSITLEQIDALFDRLNDDEQLLLIDHLAERTQVHDELGEGIEKAVFAYVTSLSGAGEVTEVWADQFYPAGAISPAIWKAHAIKRDATLEGAIRLRALGNGRRAA